MIKDTQVAQFIATAKLHLSLLPVIIDDSYLPQYKTLNLFKKERLRGYFSRWGLTELTVNSCFFDTPPRAYLNYNIYILIFICVWGEPCIFGVLTVNLLTPRSFFPVSVLCGA